MSIGMREDVLRRGTLWRVVRLFVLGCGLLCAPSMAAAQSGGVNQGGEPYIHQPAGMDPLPEHGASDDAVLIARMRHAERQRRIAADTAKLVALTNQLKAVMDQTPKDQISVVALEKTDEIEKVARDLKSWIKNRD